MPWRMKPARRARSRARRRRTGRGRRSTCAGASSPYSSSCAPARRRSCPAARGELGTGAGSRRSRPRRRSSAGPSASRHAARDADSRLGALRRRGAVSSNSAVDRSLGRASRRLAAGRRRLRPSRHADSLRRRSTSSRRSLMTFSGRKCSRLLVQDPAQPLDVGGVELPVARRRALGVDEALALEEADLRDRDVGELVAQLVEHLADREVRRARPCSTSARRGRRRARSSGGSGRSAARRRGADAPRRRARG